MAPDRGRSERDDPRACNPLTRRVAAEVVRRTGHSVNAAASIENEKEVVVCDKQAVFKLKDEQRQKWLQKALKQASQGIITPGEVYDVVSSTRFAENLAPKVGRKMGLMLKDGLKLFTAKQQKFIMEKAVLVTRFVTDMPSMDDNPVPVAKPKKEKKEKKDKDKGKDSGDVEDMMARIRGFVRDKQAQRGERGDDDKGGKDSKRRRSRSRSGSRSKSRKKDKDRKRSASQSSNKGKKGRGKSRSQSSRRSRSRSAKKEKDVGRRSGKSRSRDKSGGRGKNDSKRKRSRSGSSDSHRKDNKGRPAAKRGRASASKSRSRSASRKKGREDKKLEDKPEEKKESPPEEKKESKSDDKKRQRERSSSSSS